MSALDTVRAWLARVFGGAPAPSREPPPDRMPAAAVEPAAPAPIETEPVAPAPRQIETEPVAPAPSEPEATAAEATAPQATTPEIAPPEVTAPEPPAAEVTETPGAEAGLVLRLESERGEPTTFTISREGATIGRAPENTIRLDDLSVSRKHARIAYRQSAYWLSDVGSMGGTWVDGTKLNAPRRLSEGQTVDIGVCRLTVASLAGATPARRRR